MSVSPLALATKDNAKSLLNATVQAADLSIPLAAGKGALFPQPYSGVTTSGGTSTTLNCTGISATIGGSAQVGKPIWNKTEDSFAIILSVATDALTTTRLLKSDGSEGSWDNGDTWCIDSFVLTLGVLNTNAYGVQSDGNLEQVLIVGRSTDILTVPTGGRGYNNTTPRQFTSSDYAYLRVTSPIVERLKDVISVLAQRLNSYQTSNDDRITDILNTSSFYAVATGSTDAYAASFPDVAGPITVGMRFFVKANAANTGTATLTVSSAARPKPPRRSRNLTGRRT